MVTSDRHLRRVAFLSAYFSLTAARAWGWCGSPRHQLFLQRLLLSHRRAALTPGSCSQRSCGSPAMARALHAAERTAGGRWLAVSVTRRFTTKWYLGVERRRGGGWIQSCLSHRIRKSRYETVSTFRNLQSAENRL